MRCLTAFTALYTFKTTIFFTSFRTGKMLAFTLVYAAIDLFILEKGKRDSSLPERAGTAQITSQHPNTYCNRNPICPVH